MNRALLIASVLALLAGCSDRCTRGPTTTCWCPGDVVGQSTCGEDGLYGACACSTTVAQPATFTPPPPPPTQRPVLMPIPTPSAVEPPSTTLARDAAIVAWIAGPLSGHDNRMAAMRRVTMRGSAGAYTITIDNQFGARCDLDFDAAGQPSALRSCRLQDQWSARPDVIAVTCTQQPGSIECQAPYQLVAPDGHTSREIIVFRRSGS